MHDMLPERDRCDRSVGSERKPAQLCVHRPQPRTRCNGRERHSGFSGVSEDHSSLSRVLSRNRRRAVADNRSAPSGTLAACHGIMRTR